MRAGRGESSFRIVQTARQLRKEMTPTEKRLWQALRNRRLMGMKFWRQHPFASYILDFYCPRHALVVEIDGEVHENPEQASKDSERTAFLNTQGIRVMRFRNERVNHDLSAVLDEIVRAAGISPSP